MLVIALLQNPQHKHTTTAAGGPIRGAIFLENTNNGIKSKEVSVRRLGEMCNIDYANLSRFENGRQDIKMLTLKAIAEALEVDINSFLG